MTTEGDHKVPGEHDLAAAGQLHPGLSDRDMRCELAGRPEAGSEGQHLLRPGGRERGDDVRVGTRVIAADGDDLCPRRPARW